MSLRKTEMQHDKAANIDTLDGSSILEILLDGQIDAATTVRSAIPAIKKASDLMTDTLCNQGILTYAGAGSSGLLGLTDGLELPGTFGINLKTIRILIAGGEASLSDLAGNYEDDEISAQRDAAVITANDCVIAISASGSTIYTLAIAKAARNIGARVIGISNTADSPLLNLSDIPILLPTSAEVIAGSTRMGAGTAQKVALNMMSTLMGIQLGHVHDGYMVNLYADNQKLRGRASQIIAAIAQCSIEQALESLTLTDGSVKHAIVMIIGQCNFKQSKQIVEDANQNLRLAIAQFESGASSI
jgi:N-acetylmuramic acid 6-phosphate etherase